MHIFDCDNQLRRQSPRNFQLKKTIIRSILCIGETHSSRIGHVTGMCAIDTLDIKSI